MTSRRLMVRKKVSVLVVGVLMSGEQLRLKFKNELGIGDRIQHVVHS